MSQTSLHVMAVLMLFASHVLAEDVGVRRGAEYVNGGPWRRSTEHVEAAPRKSPTSSDMNVFVRSEKTKQDSAVRPTHIAVAAAPSGLVSQVPASMHVQPTNIEVATASTGLISQMPTAMQVVDILDREPKPWFNITARRMIRNTVESHGANIWGHSWNHGQNWLVADGVLSEPECKQLRDDMDARERKTWSDGAHETRRSTKLGETVLTKDWFYLQSSNIVKDGAQCGKAPGLVKPSSEESSVDLFLKARRLMTTAARTFFNEGHMIHPEHTTAQRRSRPRGNTSDDQWAAANHIHQGVHADNCQVDFTGADDPNLVYCSPTSNSGFVQRSHTAVMYLSGYEHSTGGELFFTNQSSYAPPMHMRQTIPLKCGRLVVFESGPHNLHGVNTFTSGNRYAIDLWMTTQPEHFEFTHNEGLRKCAEWEAA